MDLAAQVLISILAGGGVASLILLATRTWLSEQIKRSIQLEYDQKLETYKSQLRSQTDVELEKLRSQLSTAAGDHAVRFSHLHEKRAEVISKSYSLLKTSFRALAEYTSIVEFAGTKSKEERRKEFVADHNAFIDYYTGNLIYVPVGTAAKLDAINRDFREAYSKFLIFVEKPSSGSMDFTKMWVEIDDKLRGPMQVALTELEEDFRRILGD